MSEKKYGLTELLDEYGCADMYDFLETYGHDSCVPGICTKCGTSYEYEPDQDRGWCSNCESNTVVSGLILIGVI